MPQRLIISFPNKLVSVAWDSSKKEFVPKMEVPFEPEDHHQLATIGNDIFVSTSKKILKLDNNFKQVASREFRGVKAFAADENSLFVCAEGCLIALDTRLEELSRAHLVISDRRDTKDAHDIVLLENMAYLLDNILSPIYLFRVDTANPKNLTVTARLDYEGVNTELDCQWLDPDRDEWCVVESTRIGAGFGQSIAVFPLTTGIKRRARQRLWFTKWPADQHKPQEGVSVLATTSAGQVY